MKLFSIRKEAGQAGAKAGRLGVLALLRSSRAAEETTRALRAAKVGDVLVKVLDDEIQARLDSESAESFLQGFGRPGTLLLDIDLGPKGDSRQEAVLRALAERTALIVTAPKATVDAVRRLMRLGVADFLPQPLSAAEIAATLRQARRPLRPAEPEAREPGRLIAFFHASGGMGATTLAVNLAAELAAEPIPGGGGGACLLDLDLQFGDCALFLDLDGRLDLSQALQSPERLDGAFLRGLMRRHASGLEVLAAPAGFEPLEAASPALIQNLLALAREEYGQVLVDLPPLLNEFSHGALAQADLILLVTQAAVVPLRQTRRFLDRVKGLGLADRPLAVVLNRFDRSWGADIGRPEVERALGRAPDFTIVNDFATVREALDRGIALAEVLPKARICKDLRALAEGCRERLRTAAPMAAAPSRPSLFR